MGTLGKILFFNQHDGKGMLITSAKEKLEFFVKDWNDFEVVPSLGLEVVFDIDGIFARNIVSSINADTVLTQEDIDISSSIEKSFEPMIEDLPPDIVLFPQEEQSEGEIEIADIVQEEKQIAIQQEVSLQKESITLSYSLSNAIKNYFEKIDKHLLDRDFYRKNTTRLDYKLIRRFLWTAYNNLSEIDSSIVTVTIKSLANDLKTTWHIYDDFNHKAKNPSLAFIEVFLACQAQYKRIKEGAEKIEEKLQSLKTNEQAMYARLRVKKEELNKSIDNEDFTVINQDFKSLNGAYVDIVHLIAELDEQYKRDLDILNKFEEKYRKDFYHLFAQESEKYDYLLVELLDTQASVFDTQLWKHAKNSKFVKSYFKRAGIVGELNTKTYLKYYLDTLDATKSGSTAQKLFKIYEYLLSTHKEYIMIVTAEAQDAMEFANALKRINKSYNIKVFIDEKKAIHWALNNSVKVLVMQENLRTINGGYFLEIYHDKILMNPKIILIGNKPKLSDNIMINKLLSANVSARVIAENVKSFFEEK